MSQIEIFKIPMCTKNYYSEKSKSARAQFDLYVAFDVKRLIISDIFVEFLDVKLDLYNTKEHMSNKNNNFVIRNKIFKSLGLELKPRSYCKDNKTINLNQEQLKIFNSMINTIYFQEEQKNLKSLIYQLKGNNPGGSVSKKENSELILDIKRSQDSKIFYNLPLILDCITIGINIEGDSLEFMLRKYEIHLSQIKSFNQMIDIIKNSNNLYLWNGISNLEITGIDNKAKNEKWIANMKDHSKNIDKNFAFCKEIKQSIQRSRVQYSKNVQNKKIFNITYKTEKAHIYNVEWIRQEAFDYCGNDLSKLNDAKYKKIISQVSDENNYLNLEPNIHRSFDRYEFSYNENGKLVWNKENLTDLVNANSLSNYLAIPSNKLSSELVEYIKKRNNYIQTNDLLRK
ncbi:MAG4270 family putative restriction endonuclease [Mycoplasma sp. 005V]|uniref:MAG4270 family putative restriction endonuclease n=1 Tax=Mycoplasma sp. 005V TaxID=3398776 RepID=UPI003A87BCD2